MIYIKDMFVRWTSVNGYIYIGKGDDSFKLDEVGAFIWNLIDGIVTFEEIVTAVSEKYNVSYDIVFKDVKNFCDDMEKSGLIENARE